MEKFPRVIQWLILLLASLVLGFSLQAFHVPAALLLGPMIVGVAMGLLGASVRIYCGTGDPGLHDRPEPFAQYSYPLVG